MRFGIMWFVPFLVVDHVVAFIKSMERNKRPPLGRLEADYLSNLENQSKNKNKNKNNNNNGNYITQGSNDPQSQPPFPAPAINDSQEYYSGESSYDISTNVPSNVADQDFSYLQGWNVQGSGGKGTSYLNQLSGSLQSPAPGPAPRYLDNPTPTNVPGVPSYVESLASGEMDSLFFIERKADPPLPSQPGTNTVERDAYSRYPASSYNGASSTPPDSDAWYYEMSYLKDSVSQLSNTLSSLSSQLASVVSAQTGPNVAVPSMAQIEEKMKAQYTQVMTTQNEMSKKLQSGITELRTALSKQDQSIQTLTKQGQDNSDQIASLGQSVSAMESKLLASQYNRDDTERRLMALEKRLSEQQQELRTASTRKDPRIIEVEARLQEQADLLKEVIDNPDSHLEALESKLGELERELFAVSNKSEARVATLERQWQDQRSKLEAAKSQPDPRIAMLEAKMEAQEEQIRAATEVISDARITALRAKLTEQQEQMESATRAWDNSPSLSYPEAPGSGSSSPASNTKSRDPTPALWTNPFKEMNGKDNDGTQQEPSSSDKDKNDGKKSSKWLPWGQSWKKSKNESSDRDGVFASAPAKPPVPLVAEQPPPSQPGFRAPQDAYPWEKSNNVSPPSFGTYQNVPKTIDEYANGQQLNGTPPPEGPAGSFKGSPFGRGKGITIDTALESKPPTMTKNPAQAMPRPSAAATAPAHPEAHGTFKGFAFGNSNGMTTESGRSQTAHIPSNAAPPISSESGRSSSPPPPVTSDQDQWDPERPNPDAVTRPIIKTPISPKLSTDSGNSGRGKISSDQDLWDPDRPNPDAVKRPIIERRRNTSSMGQPKSRLAAQLLSARSAQSPNEEAVDQTLGYSGGYHEKGNGRDAALYARDVDSQSRPPTANGVAADQANWRPDAANPDAVNGQYNVGPRLQQPRKSSSGAKGVTSDQGRWDSASQIRRDNGDTRSTESRTRGTSTVEMEQADLFHKSQVLSAYLNWCKSYGKEPDESRFEQFSRNYSRMEDVARQTGRFPAMNEYADYSQEEFARMNGSPSYP